MNPVNQQRSKGRISSFGGFVEGIVTFFGKSGPWAVLCVLLLGGLAYELDSVVRTAGKSVTDYVVVSTRNIEKLSDSMTDLQDRQSAIMTAMAATQSSVIRNGEQIAINQSQIKALVAQMQQAYDMMKGVPLQRQEELKLLQQIDEGIRRLNKQFGEQYAAPPPEEP